MLRHRVWTSVLTAGVLTLAACESNNPVGPAPLDSSLTTTNATAAGQTTPAVRPTSASVVLCHVTGNGRYQPLRISENAEAAHRAHGDARIGEPVPGESGMIFDENCDSVRRSFVITSGTWMTSGCKVC